MRLRIIIVFVVLLLGAALIAYREFITRTPCGPDWFADNGGFENGNFVPDSDGGMRLPNNSADLTDWSVFVSTKSNNPLLWMQNGNRINVSTNYGQRFIILVGSGNPPQEPYPGVSKASLSLPPEHYQLRFALGQDRNGFPGPVSADVDLTGVVTQHKTFPTDGSGPNWQEFTLEFDVINSGSTGVSFTATPGQGSRPVRYIGLDNVSLREFVPVFQCRQGKQPR